MKKGNTKKEEFDLKEFKKKHNVTTRISPEIMKAQQEKIEKKFFGYYDENGIRRKGKKP